ncbi:hypothetical protein BpHYR1_054228 [Brachionus plicatilis]|uniref:RRM domain-containing protein n=1 Tax=Brachionus plicatilis TaxID=10195 RepID=A0A3M7PCP1_BRAPC|nr:hypothetical protein BpHYR1_054228 [Brachionus plicatilis]
MSNEIYDLYVSKISRFNSNHEVIQELAEFLDMMVKTNEYVEKGTCVGFVRFQNFNKHDSIARFLFKKEFAGREIRVWRNNFPKKATLLSKAYKLKNQVAATRREAATNTEESDYSPGELKKETELRMRAENELLNCREKMTKAADIINLNSKTTWRLMEERDEFSDQLKTLKSDKLKMENELDESNEEIYC